VPRLAAACLRAFHFGILVLAFWQSAYAGGAQRDAETERRIEALLARMTLAEKVGQLNLTSRAPTIDPQRIGVEDGRIGGVLNVVHPDEIRQLRAAARRSRLGIPPIVGLDAVHMFRVTMPPPIAWAATWRLQLAEEAAEVIAREAADVGIDWTFAPMVDVSRDPRWGRVIEGAGEDPLLASAFAAARVRGYRKGGLATAVKHFVGYGAPEAGRDYNGAQIPTAELHDRYLPPFKAAIEAGSETVMAAFNSVNGVPVSIDRRLLTDLLRGRLGFDGFLTADYNAIGELLNHGVAADLGEAAAKALLAGIDVDMRSGAYDEHLAALVETGRVPLAAVEEAVRRVLRVKFRLGLFDPERQARRAAAGPLEPERVRRVAREVARQSFVLLKNFGDVLPLSDRYKRIALIGAWAASDADTSWYGPAGLSKPDTTTLVDAMRARLGSGQELVYVPAFADPCGSAAPGRDEAIAAARAADLVVLVVMEDCEISGEGASRIDLDLSSVHQGLLAALAASGTPVVLVVGTGRPLTLAEAEPHAAAILLAWQGGTETRIALAEVLRGEVAPSGKLPMTFPRAMGQIPISYDVLPTSRPPAHDRYTSRYLDGDVTPLYPFGFGLSYTHFAYANLEVERASIGPDGTLALSVDVSNKGPMAAEETVQAYVRQLVASRSRPLRQLKAFDKIRLEPGATARVAFRIEAAQLGYHDDEARYVVEPGPFQVFVGGSSAAELSARFEIARD
jgi:beta-glucosidase